MHTVQELIDFSTQGGGEDLAHRFIGTTPYVLHEPGAFRVYPYYRRESECRLWLSGNGYRHSWLAIDDYARYFSPACTSLFLVDTKTGLTEEAVAAIIQRINQAY